MTDTKPAETQKTPVQQARTYGWWVGMGISLAVGFYMTAGYVAAGTEITWITPVLVGPILVQVTLAATLTAVFRFVFGWMAEVLEELKKR